LATHDGGVIHGRTLEFAVPLTTSIVVVPRKYTFFGTTSEGKGLSYTANYAVVGVMLFNDPAVVDGMNEKGLSVGTFYFPEYAQYTKLTKENQSKALSPVELPNFLLTQFATVNEVKSAMNRIVVVGTPLESWGNKTPPFHYIVYDKTGASVVIEPINGKLALYDNNLGVLTNSPNFDWHMTNLRQYINLTTKNPSPLKIDGLVMASLGQGGGMVGLPGDFTPPSRFVRAAIFSYTALASKTRDQAVLQAFHILNQFDIPLGVVRGTENGKVHLDYTVMTSVRDPQALKYYFKTYENPSTAVVDLNAFDLNATTIKKWRIKGEERIKDISSQLK